MAFFPTITNNVAAYSPQTLTGKNHASRTPAASTSYHQDAPLSEEQLAALTIYLEARGESFAGKLAVAAVIRNRMNAKYHSDGTVKGTVLKRLQFQPWNYAKPEVVRHQISQSRMKDSLLAWRMVQDGRTVVDGALLFYNPRLVKPPFWATVSHKVASIGGHEFYVPPGKRNEHQV
ncbi:MAG: cell wall hydrolase [Nitrospira sp.]|nr:cell wall hydrolase [Nitrospira sp.]